jgi:hypothetical protein
MHVATLTWTIKPSITRIDAEQVAREVMDEHATEANGLMVEATAAGGHAAEFTIRSHDPAAIENALQWLREEEPLSIAAVHSIRSTGERKLNA